MGFWHWGGLSFARYTYLTVEGVNSGSDQTVLLQRVSCVFGLFDHLCCVFFPTPDVFAYVPVGDGEL